MNKWESLVICVALVAIFGGYMVVAHSRSQAQIACFKAAEEVAKSAAVTGSDIKINCNSL